jgi:hypothetical protein
MKSFNILEIGHEDTILYHAIARDEEEVRELASANEIDLTDMVIELERSNVKNELGRSYAAHIEDAQAL